MNFVETIGMPAVLEQCAEECAELAHACLKLSRILRDENPTPVNKDDAISKVSEEFADVSVCICQLVDYGLFSPESIDAVAMVKTDRWAKRINEAKNK